MRTFEKIFIGKLSLFSVDVSEGFGWIAATGSKRAGLVPSA